MAVLSSTSRVMRPLLFYLDTLRYAVNNRQLLLSLIINDFRRQYLGSYFGITWAFVQPLIMVLVLWAVFDIGLRGRPVDESVPFVIWLMAGMIPWFFFAEGMTSGLQALTSNAFLLKKIAFRVDVLPLVKATTSLLIHAGLLLFLLLMALLHKVEPSLYWLQLPFYTICLFLLLTGLTSLTAAIYVFVRDTKNIIAILTQMGFWLTPVFWPFDRVPEKFHWLLQLNPVFYITKGYRDALLSRSWFWENEAHTLIFLVELLLVLFMGCTVFDKLRVHFGDVL